MRFVMFYHSLVSDWNHGNAHFLRGIVTELMRRGHETIVYEPVNGWSYRNLIEEHGNEAIRSFARCFPHLSSRSYDSKTIDLDEVCEGADVVIVHEWNSPELISKIGRHRRLGGKYRLLFHDTHHRALTSPESMGVEALKDYDGALVFGECLRNIYRSRAWVNEVWVWHEAADTTAFRPGTKKHFAQDLVWIGNWGDGERTEELKEFFLGPARTLHLRTKAYGVRYPREAVESLSESGVDFGGWLPNFRVPEVFGESYMTVHIPRRPYREALPGIPTIRVFEALACGIPLVCSTWEDRESLFTVGKDYLMARSGTEMATLLRALREEPAMREELARNSVATIERKHTCRHRVDQLMEIVTQ